MMIHVARLYAILIFPLFCLAGLSEAQQPTDMTNLLSVRAVLKGDKLSLPDVTAALARSLGHSIIVDDEPQLQQVSFDLEGTASDILDKVSDQFDYTWSLTRRGVIVMHKRFRDPNEHPQLNLPEIKRMSEDILGALRLFGSRPSSAQIGPSLHALYYSFAPEQLQRLNAGGIIHVHELSPEQQSLVEKAIIHAGFGHMQDDFQLLSDELTALDRSSVRLVGPAGTSPPQNRQDGTAVSRSLTIHDLLYAWPSPGGQRTAPLVHLHL